jgi:S-adenosylmethionine:tRNA ribosyltransferase-isomerase
VSAVRFALPSELEAGAPPRRRDDVRLLVARPDGLAHAAFDRLGEYLRPGDLLVVNTSATLPAAVDGRRADGRGVLTHFSTALDDGDWIVEFRPDGPASGPARDIRIGERVGLPDGVELSVVAPYPADRDDSRLWRVDGAPPGGGAGLQQRARRPHREGVG